jgi:hypothetical protein
MEIAATIGIDPLTFWDLTISELNVMVRAANKRQEQDHENQITIAYMNAYWHRVKQMPTLKEVIGDKQPVVKEQKAEQMLNEIIKLNQIWGGTVY